MTKISIQLRSKISDMQKDFTIGLNLDDRSFKQKLSDLLNETSKLGEGTLGGNKFSNLSDRDKLKFQTSALESSKADFFSTFSKKDVALSNRRIEAGMGDDRDKFISGRAKEFDELGKLLQQANKLQSLTLLEEKSRHLEYKSLTTQQLEVERKQLRTDIEQLDKEGKVSESEEKRSNLSAVNKLIAERKGEEGKEDKSGFKQFAQNYFVNEAMKASSLLGGEGTERMAGSARTGYNAYSAASMGGMGGMGAGLIGAAVGLADLLIGSVKDVLKQESDVLKSGVSVGGSDYSGNYDKLKDFGNEGFFSTNKLGNLGIKTKDAASEMSSYSKTSTYGGTDFSGMVEDYYNKKVLEKSLNLSTGAVQQFESTGVHGNRMDTSEAMLGFAKMLEDKKVGNIKVGEIDSEGNVVGRNLIKLESHLKNLVEINEDIFKITGEKNKETQEQGMRMFGSILGMGGIFQNKDVASETLGGIRKGFSAPTSSIHQFRNIQAYRQVTGDESVVGMMEDMENMDNIGVINKFRKNLASDLGIKGEIGRGGGTQEQMYLKELQQSFGLSSQTKARELHNKMESGQLQDIDMSKYVKKDSGERLAEIAEKFVTKSEKMEAISTKMLDTVGKGFLDLIDKFTTTISNFGDHITKFGEWIQRLWEKLSFFGDGGGDKPPKPETGKTAGRGGVSSKK